MYFFPKNSGIITTSLHRLLPFPKQNTEKSDILKEHKNFPEYTPNLDYDFTRASASTDCTGAMPRPPENTDELDAYLDVYNFLPQCSIAQKKQEPPF